MNAIPQSAGSPIVISSTVETGNDASVASMPPRAPRDGRITIAALIDAYMSHYAGRDPSRAQRLAWWADRIGQVQLGELTDDLIAHALDDLAAQRGRYWARIDVDGKPIYRAKKRSFSGASVNRYSAALAAVLTWTIKKRIAPPGWASPMTGIERRLESRGRVRFLSPAERQALLDECQRSTWSKLYLLVLLALTTGARRGELEALRWADVDLDAAICTLHTTKNNDRRILPLTPARPLSKNSRNMSPPHHR
jgi:integrase